MVQIGTTRPGRVALSRTGGGATPPRMAFAPSPGPSGIGAAGAAIGQALAGLAAVREQREEFEALRSVETAMGELKRWQMEQITNAPEAGAGLTEASQTRWDEVMDHVIGEMAVSQTDRMQARLEAQRQAFITGAWSAELDLTRQYSLNNIADMRERAGAEILEDAGAWYEWEDRVGEMIAAAPGMTVEEKRQLARDTAQMMGGTYVQSRLMENQYSRRSQPFSEESRRWIPFIIAAESSGNPRALSPVGAAGIMQVMPGTARDIAREIGDAAFPHNGTDDEVREYLFREENGLTYGTYYFNKRLREFGGDVEAALIAYNAGAGRARRFLRDGRNFAGLPEETQNYVNRIFRDAGVLTRDQLVSPELRMSTEARIASLRTLEAQQLGISDAAQAERTLEFSNLLERTLTQIAERPEVYDERREEILQLGRQLGGSAGEIEARQRGIEDALARARAQDSDFRMDDLAKVLGLSVEAYAQLRDIERRNEDTDLAANNAELFNSLNAAAIEIAKSQGDGELVAAMRAEYLTAAEAIGGTRAQVEARKQAVENAIADALMAWETFQTSDLAQDAGISFEQRMQAERRAEQVRTQQADEAARVAAQERSDAQQEYIREASSGGDVPDFDDAVLMGLFDPSSTTAGERNLANVARRAWEQGRELPSIMQEYDEGAPFIFDNTEGRRKATALYEALEIGAALIERDQESVTDTLQGMWRQAPVMPQEAKDILLRQLRSSEDADRLFAINNLAAMHMMEGRQEDFTRVFGADIAAEVDMYGRAQRLGTSQASLVLMTRALVAPEFRQQQLQLRRDGEAAFAQAYPEGGPYAASQTGHRFYENLRLAIPGLYDVMEPSVPGMPFQRDEARTTVRSIMDARARDHYIDGFMKFGGDAEAAKEYTEGVIAREFGEFRAHGMGMEGSRVSGMTTYLPPNQYLPALSGPRGGVNHEWVPAQFRAQYPGFGDGLTPLPDDARLAFIGEELVEVELPPQREGDAPQRVMRPSYTVFVEYMTSHGDGTATLTYNVVPRYMPDPEAWAEGVTMEPQETPILDAVEDIRRRGLPPREEVKDFLGTAIQALRSR